VSEPVWPHEPEDVKVFVGNVLHAHRLVYEGVVAGSHRWMLHVPIERIPNPADVRMEIGIFPAHTAIELFWETT